MAPGSRQWSRRWRRSFGKGGARSPGERLWGATASPVGSGVWSPLVVAGIVDHLLLSGFAENREQAFSRLEPLGLNCGSAKHLYYQAFRGPRFRALLLIDDGQTRKPDRWGDDDMVRMAGAERLAPGKTILRTAHDPALGGPVEMQFRETK
jgi:hypothetical protein